MKTVEIVCCACLQRVPVTVGETTCEVVRRPCPHCETVMVIKTRGGRWVSTRRCGHTTPVVAPLSPPGME